MVECSRPETVLVLSRDEIIVVDGKNRDSKTLAAEQINEIGRQGSSLGGVLARIRYRDD